MRQFARITPPGRTRMSQVRMGKVQLKIMRVLWDRGRANAREITELLNRDEPIAHSTVQTLLRKLEIKGAVGHDAAERTFVFFPRVAEENVRRGATHDLVERVFGGSPAQLMSYLLKHERVSKKELEEIRRLIDEQAQKPKRGKR
jgi:BlaI family transcriptional regulator, penicillinase repressor